MTIYITVYIFIFFLALIERVWLDEKINSLYRKVIYWGAVIFIILFAGLRYQSGPDYLSYQQIYESVENWSFDRFEPGFIAVIYISKYLFGFSFVTFLFLFTAVLILVKAVFFNKYFKYPCFILFLYFPFIFIFADFGQIRNGMALSIFLWMIPAIKERNLKKYLVLFFLAVSFHYSALITLPLYWATFFRIDLKRFFLLYAISFIIFATNLPQFLVSVFLDLFPNSPISKIFWYIFAIYKYKLSLISFFKDIGGMVTIFLVILYNKVYTHEIKENKENSLELTAYKGYVLLFIFIKVFHSIYAITLRGVYYSAVLEYFIIYYLFNRIKEKEAKLLYIILFIIYGFIKLVFYIGKYYVSYENYQLNWRYLGF